jgi:hypothetical protein
VLNSLTTGTPLPLIYYRFALREKCFDAIRLEAELTAEEKNPSLCRERVNRTLVVKPKASHLTY